METISRYDPIQQWYKFLNIKFLMIYATLNTFVYKNLIMNLFRITYH